VGSSSLVSVLLYNWLYGVLFFVFLAFMVYGVLRRIGCGSCYLCKSYTSGFGRLSGVFFGRGFVKKGSVGYRLGVVVFIYFLLLPMPVGLLAISLLGAFSFVKVLVLVCLLAEAIYSLTTWYNSSTATKKRDLGEGFKRLNIKY